jgi:hypothetical protein
MPDRGLIDMGVDSTMMARISASSDDARHQLSGAGTEFGHGLGFFRSQLSITSCTELSTPARSPGGYPKFFDQSLELVEVRLSSGCTSSALRKVRSYQIS